MSSSPAFAPGAPPDRGTPRRGYGHRAIALVILLCAQLMVILDNTHSCANRVPRVPVRR